MTTALQDCPAFTEGADLSPHKREWYLAVLMAGAGVTSTINTSLPTAPAVANGASSIFAVTNLPPMPIATGAAPRVVFAIYSPAATVTECIVTAFNATNGTMSYRTSKAGTATDPAASDVITIIFEGECR